MTMAQMIDRETKSIDGSQVQSAECRVQNKEKSCLCILHSAFIILPFLVPLLTGCHSGTPAQANRKMEDPNSADERRIGTAELVTGWTFAKLRHTPPATSRLPKRTRITPCGRWRFGR